MYFSTRVAADRPINADVPDGDPPEDAAPRAEAEAKGPEAPATPPAAGPEPPGPKRRGRVPGALLLIAGLVVVAVGFILLAVLAGRGGGPNSDSTARGPAPAPVVVHEKAANQGQGEAAEEAAAAEASEELGYPAFATDNTTRVGGSTAAENAAAVALAIFPSTTPKQRPAAVVLVPEEEWAAAIAAAVLIAPPVRAPLLFSGQVGLGEEAAPEATEEALAALDPQGSKATGGARGFALGGAVVPDSMAGVEAIRPAGATDAGLENAAANAGGIASLRERLTGSPPNAFVVAPYQDPGFAAPAAAWAARSGDPVLFAAKKVLPKETEEALQRHAKVPVYVLGPRAAIADSVLGKIKKLGNPIKRVAGSDPVGNALALARYHDGAFGWDVNDPGHGFVLARDDSPLNAAAAAALSAAGTWGPLLLTDSADTLPDEVRSYLLDVKPGYTTNPTRAYYNHVWVIGDQEEIDVKQQAEVNELAELAKIGEG
jgi:hypothetical protein